MSLNDEVTQFKRKLLSERLEQCTAVQRANFGIFFPDGVADNKLDSAIALCDRSITKNRAAQEEEK
jgi:hypothetical protein